MEIFPGISMGPGVRFGKPCIAGTRVDVATVVADMGAGESLEAVQDAYQLTREQVLAALRYAAHLAAHAVPAVSEGEELVAAKGMSPIRSIEDLKAYSTDLFESDEELEEFLAFVREQRSREFG